jgi:hypothetical protein
VRQPKSPRLSSTVVAEVNNLGPIRISRQRGR